MTTTIYALIDPRSDHVRYIGKTRKGIEWRLKQHTTGPRKAVRSSHWIHSLLVRGYYPNAIELESGLSETEWPEAEQFWIAYFKMIGADLTNHTNGGHHIIKKKCLEPSFPISKAALLDLAKNKEFTGIHYRVFYGVIGITLRGAVATQKALSELLGLSQSGISSALRKMTDLEVISKISSGGANGYMVSGDFVSRGSLK